MEEYMWIIKESIYKFVEVVNFLIIARIILSWFARDYSNPIFRILYNVTEPILSPFRNLLFKMGIGGSTVDFSPIFAILTLDMVSRLLVSIL
jgi:YggT family protein